MTKKQNINTGIFYLFTPIVANFVVLLLALLIDFPLPDSDEYKVWTAFLDEHFILNTVPTFFSFAIPIFLCVRYVIPIFKGDKTAKFHAANIPIVFAALGMLGWILMLLFQTFLTVYIQFSLGEKIYSCLKVSAMFTCLAAVLVFVVVFLVLESVNRAKILHLYFPNGKIAAIKNFISPSIRLTFWMYYIGVAVFPVVVLLFALLTKEKNWGMEISWNLFFVTLIFLFSGTFITLLLANLFKKPLQEMTKAAEKISEGDFKNRVKVVSGDEIGILGDTFNDMAASLLEKEFMKDVFGKVVTPDVRDHLLYSGMEGIALGGENTVATILFCDIRGFTSLSEKMESEKVVQLLNYYFTAMSECIMRHHGIINKYIGDAIMAIFGAPVKSKTHAQDAYLAALEMKNALAKVNEEFKKRNFPEIRFGIGIHTGKVVAGNIGSASRMEYTVIGDSVNVASRIEGLCKEYKKALLISESTVKEMENHKANFENGAGEEKHTPQFLCESAIRGKEEKIRIYSA